MRKQRTCILERRNRLLEILTKHRGLTNVVSTKEILSEMKQYGYNLPARGLPNEIRRIRLDFNMPISYARTKGYFIAISKEDILTAVADLENQIKELQNHINFLKSFNLG